MATDYEAITRFNQEQLGKDTASRKSQVNMYSDFSHFLFEILQNADDYGATAIEFVLDETGLLIEHNGEPFTEENVKAISYFGKSTSRDDLIKTGRFGLGFKSVFAVTASPVIHSGDEHFEIYGLYRLRPAPVPVDLQRERTRIQLPFNHEDMLPDFVEEFANKSDAFGRISERLRRLDITTLLFTRNLKEIRWTVPDDHGHYLREDNDKREIGETLQARNTDITDGDLFHSYRVFSRPIAWNGEDHKPVEIAFFTEKGAIRPTKRPFFVLFPTTLETHMGLIVNGPFRTPAHRETVNIEDTFNRFLVEQISFLTQESLIALRDERLMSVEVLEALPIRPDDFSAEWMFSPIASAVRETLRTEELLPSLDQLYVAASHAKLARGDDLRRLLSSEQLSKLFRSPDGQIRWLASNLSDDLRSYVTKELGVEEVRPQHFAQLLSKAFLQSQSDDWIIQFYRFLGKDQADLWEKPGSVLRQKEILRLQSGSHVSLFEKEGKRNAYLPPDRDVETTFPTLRSSIANDSQAAGFLSRFGLTRPDLFSEVIEFILPKYTVSNIQVDRQDNIHDLLAVLKSFKVSQKGGTDNETMAKIKVLLTNLRMEELFAPHLPTENIPEGWVDLFYPWALGRVPLIWANNAANEKKYCQASEVYINTPDLQSYFSGNEEAWFVSEDYPDGLNNLFVRLSISREPRVTLRSKDLETGHVMLDNSHSRHRRGLNGFDPHIKVDGLAHALLHPTFEKSCYIWNKFAIEHSDSIRGIVQSSRRATYENATVEEEVSPNFGELLLNRSWLPSLDGGFVKPQDIALDDLPEGFNRDEKLARQLKMKQNVLASLAQAAGVSEAAINIAREFEKLPQTLRNEVERILDRAKRAQPGFPGQTAPDLDRRKEKVQDDLEEAPTKQYDVKERSVRTSRNGIDPEVWLRELYSDDDGHVFCQICHLGSPFSKRNGEYYFERIEALSKNHFSKEYEAQFLALCPVCAARYKEFVRTDEPAMQHLKELLLDSEGLEVPLQLGEVSTTLRFVKTHREDLRTIIQMYSGDGSHSKET